VIGDERSEFDSPITIHCSPCAPVLLVIEQQSGRRDESFLILWTDTFDRRFKFEKRCRLLVSTDDKSLPVVAVHSNIAFNFVNSSWMPSCMTVEA